MNDTSLKKLSNSEFYSKNLHETNLFKLEADHSFDPQFTDPYENSSFWV